MHRRRHKDEYGAALRQNRQHRPGRRLRAAYDFILCGVSRLGSDSVTCPDPLRLEPWERMAGDLKPRRLERIADRTIPLEGVAEVFEKMLRGRPAAEPRCRSEIPALESGLAIPRRSKGVKRNQPPLYEITPSSRERGSK